MNSPKHSRAAARVEKYQRWQRQQANVATEPAVVVPASKAAWRSKKLAIPQQAPRVETVVKEEPPVLQEEEEVVEEEMPSSVSARRQAFDRFASPSSNTSKPSWKRPTVTTNNYRNQDDETSVSTVKSIGKKFAAADRWNQVASPTATTISPPTVNRKQPAATDTSPEPCDTVPDLMVSTKSRSKEEAEVEEPPTRLRVSDVRSMFQQKAASRPVRTFQSPKSTSSNFPMSPIPKISSPVSTDEVPSIATEEPAAAALTIQEVQEETITTTTKQWDSPRRARLRALAAAATTTTVEPNEGIIETPERGRISDIFQRKIDSSTKKDAKDSFKKEAKKYGAGAKFGGTHRNNDEVTTHRQIPAETINVNAEPEEQPEAPHEAIETPQKLSVSAMKAKLWGDAERLKVPTRKAPSSAAKNFEPPTSPIADTRRIFDQRRGVAPSPQSPVLSSPPRTFAPYYGTQYQAQTNTPPRGEEDESEYNDPTLSPMPDSEDEILLEQEQYEEEHQYEEQHYGEEHYQEENYDRTETELGNMQEDAREVEPTAQEPPPSHAWMNRTFKRNIGSALESKIQSLWGGNNTNQDARDMQLPELRSRAHPPRPSSRSSVSPVRNGVSPPLSTVSQCSSGMPPPIDENLPKGHYRSTSIGDYQVESDRIAAPLNVGRGRPDEARDRGVRSQDDFRALSPPNRPAFVQTRDRSDEPLSPLYQDKPPRGRVMYEMAETGFSEAIDQPPFEDASETSDFVPPVSPRSNRGDYPWTKDAGSLSPGTWQKREEPDFDDDVQPVAMPSRNRNLDFDTHYEDDDDDDQQESGQHSPNSLNQMAKDSFFAVDHDQAMEAFEHFGKSDDERSSTDGYGQTETIPHNVPPEFERVLSGELRARSNNKMPPSPPVFGDPESFRAAGDEQVPRNSLSVAERAQAIAAWNGGLGVAPNRADRQDTQENSQRMSPFPSFNTGESTFKGMSPDFERKGVAIDDWNIERVDKGAAIDQSTDVWGLVSLDSFAENDWATGGQSGERAEKERGPASSNQKQQRSTSNEEAVSLEERELFEPRSEPSNDAFSSSGPIDADDVYFSMTASVQQPESPAVPERTKAEVSRKPPKKLKDWRKSQGKASKRERKSIASAPARQVTEFVFDPFNDPFESKVDNTETTEPTDSTDLFGSSDPFSVDQNLFAPNVMKPIARRSNVRPEEMFEPTEPLSYAREKTFAELAAPSGTFEDSKEEMKDGSKDDVWSCDIGLSSEGVSYEMDNGNPVVYDADTSNLNESSAVEI